MTMCFFLSQTPLFLLWQLLLNLVKQVKQMKKMLKFLFSIIGLHCFALCFTLPCLLKQMVKQGGGDHV